MESEETFLWRSVFPSIILVAVAVFCNDVALAQKGGKGGGGGSESGPSYQIIRLNTDDGAGGALTGSAFDINDSRLVIGGVVVPAGDVNLSKAVHWTVTESKGVYSSSLNYLDDTGHAATHTIALGCSELGEIVGQADDAVAVYWFNKNAPLEELPAPLAYSSAEAICGDGVICGWSATGFSSQDEKRALVWDVNQSSWGYLQLMPLGDPGDDQYGNSLPNQAIAVAVSAEDPDSGLITIAGESNGNSVIWTVYRNASGALQSGPAMILDPGFATGLNNSGLVCGTSGSVGVVWVNGAAAIPLAFDDSRTWGSPHPGFPTDVNDNGMLVGDNSAQAVLWPTRDAALVVLDGFLPRRNSPFASLTAAHAVNGSNEIVGAGSPDGSPSRLPFLAIPK